MIPVATIVVEDYGYIDGGPILVLLAIIALCWWNEASENKRLARKWGYRLTLGFDRPRAVRSWRMWLWYSWCIDHDGDGVLIGRRACGFFWDYRKINQTYGKKDNTYGKSAIRHAQSDGGFKK